MWHRNGYVRYGVVLDLLSVFELVLVVVMLVAVFLELEVLIL